MDLLACQVIDVFFNFDILALESPGVTPGVSARHFILPHGSRGTGDLPGIGEKSMHRNPALFPVPREKAAHGSFVPSPAFSEVTPGLEAIFFAGLQVIL